MKSAIHHRRHVVRGAYLLVYYDVCKPLCHHSQSPYNLTSRTNLLPRHSDYINKALKLQYWSLTPKMENGADLSFSSHLAHKVEFVRCSVRFFTYALITVWIIVGKNSLLPSPRILFTPQAKIYNGRPTLAVDIFMSSSHHWQKIISRNKSRIFCHSSTYLWSFYYIYFHHSSLSIFPSSSEYNRPISVPLLLSFLSHSHPYPIISQPCHPIPLATIQCHSIFPPPASR